MKQSPFADLPLFLQGITLNIFDRTSIVAYQLWGRWLPLYVWHDADGLWHVRFYTLESSFISKNDAQIYGEQIIRKQVRTIALEIARWWDGWLYDKDVDLWRLSCPAGLLTLSREGDCWVAVITGNKVFDPSSLEETVRDLYIHQVRQMIFERYRPLTDFEVDMFQDRINALYKAP